MDISYDKEEESCKETTFKRLVSEDTLFLRQPVFQKSQHKSKLLSNVYKKGRSALGKSYSFTKEKLFKRRNT